MVPDFLKRARPGVRRIVAGSVVGFCTLITHTAAAQQRPLTAKDFDSWRTISGQTLTHDGRYLAYGVFPEEGDGEVVVRDLKANRDLPHIPAGQLPPPPMDDPNAEGRPRRAPSS